MENNQEKHTHGIEIKQLEWSVFSTWEPCDVWIDVSDLNIS